MRLISVITVVAIVSIVAAAQGPPPNFVDTNVCELVKNPDSYNKKVVRLHAFISRGFEDSTLYDPDCAPEALVNFRVGESTAFQIWADFADDAKWERVKGYLPLARTPELDRFRKLIIGRRGQMTSATLVGTFFAGKPLNINGQKVSARGFGHMGCCSLLVIATVESVDEDYSPNLNYTWADWNVGIPEGCYSEQMVGVPTNAELRNWQKLSAAGHDEWRFNPKLVAEDQLKRLKAGAYGSKSGGSTEVLVPGKQDLIVPKDDRPSETLLEEHSTAYRKTYVWIEPDRLTRIYIVVARPYWLQPVAGSPDKVIWVPTGSSVVCCGEFQKKKKKK